MVDYKKLYYKLFNSLTDILSIVVKTQKEAENEVITDNEHLLKLIEKNENIVPEDNNC